MILIGITGLKGSGKTTVSQILQAKGFHRMRFAGVLKDMLATLGLSNAEIDGECKEKPSDFLDGKTPRYAMQTLGTEWGRELISPNLWVNSLRKKIHSEKILYPWRNIVIDDARFPNEISMIKSFAEGRTWRVVRPGLSPEDHPSERDIPNLEVDSELDNSGTLEDLQRNVLKIL